ncbi:MAG: hypothetical protein Q9216_000487 [Gyalolechia sp. 2 TL-2023]
MAKRQGLNLGQEDFFSVGGAQSFKSGQEKEREEQVLDDHVASILAFHVTRSYAHSGSVAIDRPDAGDFRPEQLEASAYALQIRSLKAAREDRLTFGMEELPHEVRSRISGMPSASSSMGVRGPIPLASPFPFNTLVWFACIFHPTVKSHADKFISTPTVTSRFTTSSAFQCYEALPSLKTLVLYIQRRICPKADTHCFKRANRLQRADYLDIDYDAVSRILVLTSFRHKPPEPEGWEEYIESYRNSPSTEVGLLSNEQAVAPEELSLGGSLTIVGEDQTPSMPALHPRKIDLSYFLSDPARFSFPSRHHLVPSTSGSIFHTTFLPPTGLHPTLRLTFPSSSMLPPAPPCGLHIYLTLPSPLFVDKYQLSSTNFLASKNLRAIRALSGETDLEAPEWVIQKWGSVLLLEIAPPTPELKGPSQGKDRAWHADIPLHLRYLSPTVRGTSDVQVPWPIVFWACPAEEGTKMNVNPFDRVNLGYESLFGPRTMFYHLQPQPAVEGGRLMETVHVPVMDLQGTKWVESATMGVVAVGAVWVGWKLFRALLGLGESEAAEKKLQ